MSWSHILKWACSPRLALGEIRRLAGRIGYFLLTPRLVETVEEEKHHPWEGLLALQRQLKLGNASEFFAQPDISPLFFKKNTFLHVRLQITKSGASEPFSEEELPQLSYAPFSWLWWQAKAFHDDLPVRNSSKNNTVISWIPPIHHNFNPSCFFLVHHPKYVSFCLLIFCWLLCQLSHQSLFGLQLIDGPL